MSHWRQFIVVIELTRDAVIDMTTAPRVFRIHLNPVKCNTKSICMKKMNEACQRNFTTVFFILKSDLVPSSDVHLSCNPKHVMCYIFIVFTVSTVDILTTHSFEHQVGYGEMN